MSDLRVTDNRYRPRQCQIDFFVDFKVTVQLLSALYVVMRHNMSMSLDILLFPQINLTFQKKKLFPTPAIRKKAFGLIYIYKVSAVNAKVAK